MKTKNALVSVLVLLVSGLFLKAAPPDGAFTYQGWLASGAEVASGRYDFEFTLYDAVARGRFRLNSKAGVLNPTESLQIIDGRLWLRFDVEPGWYEFGSSADVATWGTPLIHTNIRSGVFQY